MKVFKNYSFNKQIIFLTPNIPNGIIIVEGNLNDRRNLPEFARAAGYLFHGFSSHGFRRGNQDSAGIVLPIDKGMGREVGVDEAIALLVRAQEDGLVTQPATTQNPAGMCNCCGDCCGVLRSLRSYPRPAEMVYSNHFAMVDPDLCTGCETCLTRCQMDAISINEEELAEINLDRCIGCGLCITTCPTEAMRLQPKENAYTPPVSTTEQMVTMAQKRGLM